MNVKEENVKLILGLKLRQLRESQGLLLRDVAEKTGLSISYINEIEKGKKYPKIEKVMALARALGTSYDELVSLQLQQELSPLTNIFQSNVLDNLPLNLFGFDSRYFSDLMVQSPAKFNAFVTTLVEIARTYDLSVEHFFFAALRSYQEMHNNYFADLEDSAERFAKEFKISSPVTSSYDLLRNIAETKFNYVIREDVLENYADLQHLRTVYIPGSKPVLLLNKRLLPAQKVFAIGRELGYAYLGLKERANTSTWVKVESFEQVLNNFKMSYFTGALVLPRKNITADVKALFSLPAWNPGAVQDIMQKYNASPEMLLHRMTQILPEFFGIHELYFLRFNTQVSVEDFHLTKELHISRLHTPHANAMSEHYCRRWITIKALKKLQKQAATAKNVRQPIVEIQRSEYYQTPHSYLNISIARQTMTGAENLSCVTLGIHVDDDTRKKIGFMEDAAIRPCVVNETCERCPLQDCSERAAPSTIFEQQQRTEHRDALLKVLSEKYKM